MVNNIKMGNKMNNKTVKKQLLQNEMFVSDDFKKECGGRKRTVRKMSLLVGIRFDSIEVVPNTNEMMEALLNVLEFICLYLCFLSYLVYIYSSSIYYVCYIFAETLGIMFIGT